jgi:hypothetical protein
MYRHLYIAFIYMYKHICIYEEEGNEEGEEDSGPPVYDPSYQYDGGFDATYDPTLAGIYSHSFTYIHINVFVDQL